MSLPLWTRFDAAQTGFPSREQVDWIPALGISYALGIDGISLLLVLLTTVLTPVALLFSLTHYWGDQGLLDRVPAPRSGHDPQPRRPDLSLLYVFWEVMLIRCT